MLANEFEKFASKVSNKRREKENLGSLFFGYFLWRSKESDKKQIKLINVSWK
ncbi:hypothetical protein HMPREF0027_1817 [Actinobacillus ureae ATCC 25976]|uniref:Uncharacterized protein n=1 Tax=Actinobacillus ureae ATCC 25976 TaxID=887324 RepID=E8KJ00_9PAST|nr:hypothetical protein HMPREF0027_1817 [Actinobacillus ureae ATCC 25976]